MYVYIVEIFIVVFKVSIWFSTSLSMCELYIKFVSIIFATFFN